MYRRLIPLAAATFAVGTDGFVIAALLPSIADDLEVSIPVAGQLVTVFAVTMALAAPVLGWATSAMDRRRVLVIALGIFVVGNIATALGGSYPVVLTARVVAATGAGIITSTAASAAAAVVPTERRGQALAMVLGGLTLASAVGLPLGTLIGRGDWRVTLWAVAALGLAAALGVTLGLPRIVLPATTFRARLAPLKERWVLGAVGVTMLAMAGVYLLYTYLAAALEGATGGADGLVLTAVLFVFGLGVFAGNLVAGRLVDRFRPGPVLIAGLSASVLALLLAGQATRTAGTAFVWAGTWGLCTGFLVIPQQHRLVGHEPGAAPVLLGLNASAIYLGVALGGILGGLLQHWLEPEWLGVPAALITSLALVLAILNGSGGVRTGGRPPALARTR